MDLKIVSAWLLLSAPLLGAAPAHEPVRDTLRLVNKNVSLSLVLRDSSLVADRIEAVPGWPAGTTTGPRPAVVTNAGFSFEVMWTDWQAPNMVNNADNPVTFTQKDFKVAAWEWNEDEHGGRELSLEMYSNDIPLHVRLTYELDTSAFYVRRRIALADTSEAQHFLQKSSPVDCLVEGKASILKKGGFGQPVALVQGNGGAFFGIEYPAADNNVVADKGGLRVTCRHEVGEIIGSDWLESEWAVEGLAPDTSVRLWFMKYVDDIRVAKLRPYTLYNSWYDLRSPEYPKVPQANWMNEQNVFRIISLLRSNMIEKHDIRLDAFVLDDGWDDYQSDWALNRKQFPRGLAPVADELRKTNTSLGMWLGPTGGYSFRMRRINWMKDNGYEVVGSTPNTAMLCLAGKNYGRLFRRRVDELVDSEHVGYFKWDGIQFSCSEPGHGHPVGIYSRRAVLNALIGDVQSVRERNPDIFLNITSGTWLSPWWVQYANTIWMQGSDYGYADVPSISPRDAAITYRDFVLYDDFRNQDMWFPMANLMTHGIIKGNLEWLGGRSEPLDKFTNEVLLYFARGVAMWELYISPDILSDGEWDALAQAMHWARDRFPVLVNTEMVGGDPTKGQTYGYVHFKGSRGIFSARNPLITPASLKVRLAVSQGLDPSASALVLEEVYPRRWVSPRLYKANETVDIPLDGYEAAIYEVYPVAGATGPLFAGATFSVSSQSGNTTELDAYGDLTNAKLLNPDGYTIVSDPKSESKKQPPPVLSVSLRSKDSVTVNFELDATVREGKLAMLLTPLKSSASKILPQVQMIIDGKSDTARFERTEGASVSAWYTYDFTPGRHAVSASVVSRDTTLPWAGSASVWMICKQQESGARIKIVAKGAAAERPMPPLPLPEGVFVRNVKIGEVKLIISR
jgi:hypothetical protein